MKKCFICSHDIINPGITNKMFEEKGHIVVVKDIPCLVCANCGEIYFETHVIQKLEKIVSANSYELEIVNFQKVA